MRETEAIQSIIEATGCTIEEATTAFYQCGYNPQTAISVIQDNPNNYRGAGIALRSTVVGTAQTPTGSTADIVAPPQADQQASPTIKITRYSNGFLIGDTFYDISDAQGQALAHMLESGCLDRNIIQTEAEEVEVTVESQDGIFNMGELRREVDRLSKRPMTGDSLSDSKKHRSSPASSRPRTLGSSSRRQPVTLALPELVTIGPGSLDPVTFKIGDDHSVYTFVADSALSIADILVFLHQHTGLSLTLTKFRRPLPEETSVREVHRCMLGVLHREST